MSKDHHVFLCNYLVLRELESMMPIFKKANE
jgi:hypothetical protein